MDNNTMANALVGALVVTTIGVIGYGAYREAQHPPTCIEQATVAAISAVHNGDVAVLLNDGTTRIISRRTTQPGDTICIRYQRRP